MVLDSASAHIRALQSPSQIVSSVIVPAPIDGVVTARAANLGQVVGIGPGLRLQGRVAYIDPRVEPATRTAKVRVEVPNRDGRLRLGMYLSMAFDTSTGQRVTLVPKAAVQSLGDRQVVFLPATSEAGKFIQRVVRLGEQRGESQVVLSGLQPGETVVTEGSFLLRAEAARNAPSG